MIDIQAWTVLAEKLRRTGLDILATAQVLVTEKGFADEKVLALTLLARTLSNLKTTLLLLREKQIVEARTIARCCYENLYWVIALAEEGAAFVRKMQQDEITHRKQRGQFMFDNGIALEAGFDEQLRDWLRNANKAFAKAQVLYPKQVAAISDIGRSYIFYSQLSSDAAHPSVTALNRYVIPDTADEVGGIDVDPVVQDKEVEETLELLCQAVMGVCVAVNEVLGGTKGASALNGLADEHIKAGELRALATASPTRIESLPEVPTVAESGYKELEYELWFGLFAPAKTPPAVISQLAGWYTAAMQVPEVKAKLVVQGLYPVGTCGSAFGELVRKQYENYGRIIREANIKAE